MVSHKLYTSVNNKNRRTMRNTTKMRFPDMVIVRMGLHLHLCLDKLCNNRVEVDLFEWGNVRG